jgi:uncharacterized protein (TIGR02266 family)
MTQGGGDRRQASRWPVELHVEFRHLGRPSESHQEISRNISTGGVFLATSVCLPLGTEVALEVTPGPGSRPIRMRAEVVRVEEDPAQKGSRSTTRARGMALRFLPSDPGEVSRMMNLARQLSTEGASDDDGKQGGSNDG